MCKDLFIRIHDAVVRHDPYFLQKRDALGQLGISSHLKITAALRILAYALPADFIEENLELSATVALESLKRFCDGVISVLGENYRNFCVNRPPNVHRGVAGWQRGVHSPKKCFDIFVRRPLQVRSLHAAFQDNCSGMRIVGVQPHV